MNIDISDLDGIERVWWEGKKKGRGQCMAAETIQQLTRDGQHCKSEFKLYACMKSKGY